MCGQSKPAVSGYAVAHPFGTKGLCHAARGYAENGVGEFFCFAVIAFDADNLQHFFQGSGQAIFPETVIGDQVIGCGILADTGFTGESYNYHVSLLKLFYFWLKLG